MRYAPGWLLLALLCCACAAHTALPPAAATLPAPVAAGDVARAERAYTAAAAAYLEAWRSAASTPARRAVALRLSDLYHVWGKPTSGLNWLAQARRYGAPENALAPRRLALLQQSGSWNALAEAAQAILQVRPCDTDALAALTQAHLQRTECSAAREAAHRWLRAAPHAPTAQRAHAILTGDLSALCRADATLCALPAAPYPSLTLGYTLTRRAEWGLAACVLETTPTPAAWVWLGEAYARLGQPDRARHRLLAVLRQEPRNALAWLLLGKQALAQSDFAIAHTALLQAQRLDPASPAPCLALAALKAAQGRYTEIAIWADAALERAPTDPAIWQAVARLYLELGLNQGDYPQKAVSGAQAMAPDAAETLLLQGWQALAHGDAAAARQALDAALRSRPDLAQAYALRAQALAQLGEHTAAQADQTRAADWTPGE